MKVFGLSVFYFLFLIVASFSQEVKISISDLQTPSSPGFVLADQAPSSVNRPRNPGGLVASFLSLNNGGSLEASPFWLLPLKNRKALTFSKYVHNNFPVVQTFSISATSVISDTASYMSVGSKFHLLRFYKKDQIQKLENDLITELTPKKDAAGNFLPLDLVKIEQLQNELNQISPKILVEVAGAWLSYSPENSFDRFRQARNGIWANALYKPISALSIVGLTRYINNKKHENFSEKAEFLDFGISLGYENGINFSISGEFVHRRDLIVEENLSRLALVGNYKLSDELYITGSFGKNFDQVENIIAILGVSLGINSEPIKLN